MSDPIDRIREALAAGPTPGDWDADFASAMRNGSPAVVEYFVRRDGDDISIAADIVNPSSGTPSSVNANYIAACSPDAIRALLDRLDAAEAENERLWKDAERRDGIGRPFADPLSIIKDICRAAWFAVEDSEEVLGEDGRCHIVSSQNFDGLSEAFDKADELPEVDDTQILEGWQRAIEQLQAELAQAKRDAEIFVEEYAEIVSDWAAEGREET